MKKIIALTALMIAFSSAAYAAGTGLASDATTPDAANGETIHAGTDATAAALDNAPVLGRLSKGVQLGVRYDNSSYALQTRHKTGSKMYGTASNSTSIYSQDAAAIAAPGASDKTAFDSGWTAM